MTNGGLNGLEVVEEPNMLIGATGEASEHSRDRGDKGLFVARYAMLALMLLLVLTFSLLMPRLFFSFDNLRVILATQSVLAIIAIAMLIPMTTGEYDLSAAANVGMSHIVVVSLTANSGLSLPLAIVITVAIGTFIGLINGILVTRVRINSLIATIGMGSMLTGAVYMSTDGRTISVNVPRSLLEIGQDTFLGIAMPVYYMAAIAVVVWYVLEHTPFGRRLYALGGAREAARLAGINVRRLSLITFVICGMLCGMAGVLTAAKMGTGNPIVGPSYMLPALAACFLGAAAIKPGTFNAAGTVVAIFTLAVGVTGLELLGVPFYIEYLFNGAALIVAVSLTRYLRREAL